MATLSTNSGAMLLFLASSEAVTQVFGFLRATNCGNCQLLPIVGPWSTDEIAATEDPLQHDANGNLRGRIIIVSPESESSLTFNHVSIVVDSQLKYQKFMANTIGAEFSLMLSTNRQETLQRRGRAGRVRAGIYLKMKPLSAPDVIPEYLSSDPDCYQLEMRSIIMEILHLIECRGKNLSPAEITTLTRTWFPNMDEKIIDAALLLMQSDGICVAGDSVYLTPIGRLVAMFPGSYDENYLVAIGAAFGCFRSMAAYVVARNSLDLWDDGSERATAWRDFFNRGVPVPGRSHLDYVESIMYWYLKSEQDNLAAIRSNANPAILVALKHDMRRYEEAMYAFSVSKENDWDWTMNDDNFLVRRMALLAGTHGNMGLFDRHEHMVVVSTGHVIPCESHSPEIHDDQEVCKVRNLSSLGVFTRLRAGNANVPDKVFGVTDCGIILPALFVDSAKPYINDLRLLEFETFFLRQYVNVQSDQHQEIVTIREAISSLITAWLAGETDAVKHLGFYVLRIADFLTERAENMDEFSYWNLDVLFGEKNPMPPAGLAHRRRWCPRCLHQDHNREQCLANHIEAKRRHEIVREGFLNGHLKGNTPCYERSLEAEQLNFKIPWNRFTGKLRCCKACSNMWHSPLQCRSEERMDGCLRCGSSGHTHNYCKKPAVCENCQIPCHLSNRCEEDRLMVDILYHLPFVAFLRTIYARRNDLQIYNNIGTIVIGRVTSNYFLKPRVEGNLNPKDPAGPDRHIMENSRKGFI